MDDEQDGVEPNPGGRGGPHAPGRPAPISPASSCRPVEWGRLHLPPPGERGLLVLVLGAVLLLIVGAGGALGVSYALSDRAATTTTTIRPTPDDAAPAAPSGTTSGQNGAASPSTTPSGRPASSAAGPQPGTATGPADDLVTPSVATSVLGTTWAGFARAMVANDRAAVSAYVTPTAGEVADATLDCGCLPGPLDVHDDGGQHPAPAQLPAVVHGRAAAARATTSRARPGGWSSPRRRPTRPWLIAYLASYAQGDGLDGFTSNSDVAPTDLHYPMADAPQAFADFFQTLDSTGATGTGAPAGYARNTYVDELVTDTTRELDTRASEGLRGTTTHRVDGVSPVFPQVVDGVVYGAMECFAMQAAVDVTSTGGTPSSSRPTRAPGATGCRRGPSRPSTTRGSSTTASRRAPPAGSP